MAEENSLGDGISLSPLLGTLRQLISDARSRALRAVDVIQVQTCWQVGRHIVEFEQGGAARAAYGKRLLPMLAEQTLRWFSPRYDRDQDALPEWPTPEHAGLTDLPNFDVWQEDGFPTQISSAESLGLAILLTEELETLQRMARVLGDEALSAQLHPHQQRLAAAVAGFRAEHPNASFIDRDTHRVHPSQKLIELQLPEPTWQSIKLETPSRLNILLKQGFALAMLPAFEVVGADAEGRELREFETP